MNLLWFFPTTRFLPSTNCLGTPFTVVFALLLGMTSTAEAEIQESTTLLGQNLSFRDLEQHLTTHPRLDQLRLQSTAMQERATTAGALPDPVISFGLNNVPIQDFSFDTFLPTNKSIGVQQAIPNSATRAARVENAVTNSAAIDIAIDFEFARLRALLITALIERTRLALEIANARQQDQKYAELYEVIRNELNAGRAVVFRLAQINIERAEVARNIVNFESELIAANAQISSLAGIRIADSTLANIEPPSVSLFQWHHNNLMFHSVRLANANIAIADARVAEVRSEFRPNWGLSFTYQQRDTGSGLAGSSFSGDDWFSGQVSFSLPIWAGRKQAPALRAAQSEKAAAGMNVSAIARKTEAEWRALVATHEAAERSIALFEQNLNSLDEQIAASLTTYESGTGDYSPIIDSEIARLSFQSQIFREIARRDIAAAQANSLLVTL